MNGNSKKLENKPDKGKRIAIIELYIGLVMLILSLIPFLYNIPSSTNPKIPSYPIFDWLGSYKFFIYFLYGYSYILIGVSIAIMRNKRLLATFIVISVVLLFIGASIFLTTLYFQYPILILTPFGLIYIYGLTGFQIFFVGFALMQSNLLYWELYKNGARRRGLLHKQRWMKIIKALRTIS